MMNIYVIDVNFFRYHAMVFILQIVLPLNFLSRCDQCTLYRNAGIIEFVSFEPVLLVKLKNVFAH